MKFYPHRRVLLATTGAAGALAIAGVVPAWAQAPRKRFGAHTTQGKHMLGIYADAVRLMNDPQKYEEGDARSWLFQWYTHGVRGDRTKATEIARVYQSGGSKTLAQAMWDTCEAHTDMTNTREDFFLPWHRIYLHCLEDIVREVAGQKDFTLPYWDYTTASRRALPEEFRRKGDAKWGSLYRESRWEHANKGLPIDHKDGPALPINLGAMSSDTYGDNGGDAGFCANLDNRLHGAVHVNIGNQVGMGDVPWAAADPIFWLHHCNIDRVWAGWIQSGGKNPATGGFLEEQFTFANASGDSIQVSVGNMLKSMEPLYDETPKRGPFPPAGPLQVAGTGRLEGDRPVSAKPGAMETVRLMQPPQGPGSGPLPVSGSQGTKKFGKARLVVRLEGIIATGPAQQAFEVYVRSAGNARLNPQSPSYLGSINFFGAGHSHAAAGHDPAGKTVSLPVSEPARQLLDAQGPTPELVFVAIGQAGNPQATVRKVAVVPR